MGDHPDRHTCGKCGNMFYKLIKDGKRLPIPKQNKPAAAAKAEAPAAAKGAAKGKKKLSRFFTPSKDAYHKTALS